MANKEDEMNTTQIRNVLQTLVGMAITYCVGRGWVDVNTATEIGSGFVALAVLALQAYHARDAGKIESAAKVPGVTIVAPDTIANASPKTNVVPASQTEVKPK